MRTIWIGIPLTMKISTSYLQVTDQSKKENRSIISTGDAPIDISSVGMGLHILKTNMILLSLKCSHIEKMKKSLSNLLNH